MKILYILKDKESLTETFKAVIDSQSFDGNTVKTVKLFENEINYDDLLDEIFSSDKVVTI